MRLPKRGTGRDDLCGRIAFWWFMMAFRALLDRPADLTQGLQLSFALVRSARTRAGPAPAAEVFQ
jgi:hypothetical protein